MRNLSKMSVKELRAAAAAFGADRKKLYGTSKQALVILVTKLHDEKQKDPEYQRLLKDVGEYIKENYEPR